MAIINCSTTKMMWDKFKEEFEGNERVKATKLLIFKIEFELLRIMENEDIKSYSSRVTKIVNQFCLARDNFSNSRAIKKIMVSILDKFEAKISAIEKSCDLTIFTVTELVSKLNVSSRA